MIFHYLKNILTPRSLFLPSLDERMGFCSDGELRFRCETKTDGVGGGKCILRLGSVDLLCIAGERGPAGGVIAVVVVVIVVVMDRSRRRW